MVAAIVALCLAPGAKREIRDSQGQIQGEGQVKAGEILSWVSVGFTALGAVLAVVLIVGSNN